MSPEFPMIYTVLMDFNENTNRIKAHVSVILTTQFNAAANKQLFITITSRQCKNYQKEPI